MKPRHAPHRTCKALGAAAIGLALAMIAAPAAADAPIDEARRKEATNYFDAGAAAFKAGKYGDAADAFLKAHATLPSPALLFSAAQAYRRQYLSEPSPPVLRRSIDLYRRYLKEDPAPTRREDAMEALQILVPIEARTPAEALAGEPGAAAPAPADKKTARVLVTVGADAAEVSLDNGPYQKAPLSTRVEPGSHTVKVRAPGYHDQQETVVAVADDLAPRHVPLRPREARLTVFGTAGARVTIDGRVRATVPVKDLPVDPGPHFIAVTLAGHEPFSKKVEAGRDEAIALKADLPLTVQRKVAWGLLGAGVDGTIATGVLLGLTFARQSDALALQPVSGGPAISAAQRDSYNRAVRERNDFGQATAVCAGASLALLAAGAGVFVLDNPEVVTPTDAPKEKKATPSATFELGFLSVGVRGTF